MMPATAEIVRCSTLVPAVDAFAHDVLRGLSRRIKTLSSAWFYDERGSELFEQITRLPEYYLTRCEHEILSAHAGEIAAAVPSERFRVVEIGAGDGHKTDILLRQFLAGGLDFEYVPVDICQRSVVDLVTRLRRTIQGEFTMRGIVAEYQDALAALGEDRPQRNLILFLGSSVGNFDHGSARRFLRGLRRTLQAGDLALLGFDLKKEPAILQAAYDDAAGVTREFNLNLLDRINRELGGRFERERFEHHAIYNTAKGCMESWLISRERQVVHVAAVERSFSFQAWEGIRVERSYKYDLSQIAGLAAAAGFRIVRQFSDGSRRFVDSLWEAK
jgi:dimethylhistidine N-methyltransferase